MIFDDLSIYKRTQLIYRASNSNLYGRHNLENISLVLAALSGINQLNKYSLKAIASFKGLPHRQEIVKKIDKAFKLSVINLMKIRSKSCALINHIFDRFTI